MALTKCPECGEKVSDRAKTCPHCGYALPRSFGITARQDLFQVKASAVVGVKGKCSHLSIPNGIKTIEPFGFESEGDFIDLEIPSSVNVVKTNHHYDKKFTVYYGGTLQQWLKITWAGSQFLYCVKALYLKAPDGEVTYNGSAYTLADEFVLPSSCLEVFEGTFRLVPSARSVFLHKNVKKVAGFPDGVDLYYDGSIADFLKISFDGLTGVSRKNLFLRDPRGTIERFGRKFRQVAQMPLNLNSIAETDPKYAVCCALFPEIKEIKARQKEEAEIRLKEKFYAITLQQHFDRCADVLRQCVKELSSLRQDNPKGILPRCAAVMGKISDYRLEALQRLELVKKEASLKNEKPVYDFLRKLYADTHSLKQNTYNALHYKPISY